MKLLGGLLLAVSLTACSALDCGWDILLESDPEYAEGTLAYECRF